MTKKTFLKKLESKLTNLDEQKIANIIKKYDHIIDEEVKTGKQEKDVVASLGDIDMIAKLYTTEDVHEESIKEEPKKEEKKDDRKDSNEGDKWTADRVINTVLTSIEDAFKSVDGDLAKRILTILCFVAIGVVFLSLIHIPFRIVDMIGSGMFRAVFNDYYFYKVVSTFWSFSIGICYAVIVIWLLVHYINQIVGRYSSKTCCKETKYTSKDEYKKETVKEEKKESMYVSDTTTSIFDIIYLILKIFIIIMTIPIIMVEASLFVALFFSVSLAVSGISFLGPVMIIIGLIFLIASLLDLIYRALSKGGLK